MRAALAPVPPDMLGVKPAQPPIARPGRQGPQRASADLRCLRRRRGQHTGHGQPRGEQRGTPPYCLRAGMRRRLVRGPPLMVCSISGLLTRGKAITLCSVGVGNVPGPPAESRPCAGGDPAGVLAGGGFPVRGGPGQVTVYQRDGGGSFANGEGGGSRAVIAGKRVQVG